MNQLRNHGFVEPVIDQTDPERGTMHITWLCIGLAITLVLSLRPLPSWGQSDNYWSWNFNTPSMLLGGSVVGGNAGSSSLFYNPSLINQDGLPSLSISASITSLQHFQGENVAGEDVNINKWIFKVQPRFVSYIFPSKNEKLSLEAAFLSPVSEELTYTIQHNDELDIIERTEGPEQYQGYIKYSRRYDDLYFGTGFSYHLSDRLLLGASGFVSVKLLRYFFYQEAQAYQNTDSVIIDNEPNPAYIAYSSVQEEMKYWDISLVLKGGALYISKSGNFSMGLNFTFPNIPIYGEATIRKGLIRSNVYDNESDAFTSNESRYGVEYKARSKVKSPFSLAYGLLYSTKGKKNMISLTAEYFHDIDMYSIAQFEDEQEDYQGVLAASPDINAVMSFYTEARAVTNVGLGFKQFISPSFSAMGGFRTDFTSGTSDNINQLHGKSKVNLVHLDKYHFTAGLVLKLSKSFIVSGLQYSFGWRQNVEEIVNFSHPVEYIPLTNQALEGEQQGNANFSIRELSVFFGLIVDFK